MASLQEIRNNRLEKLKTLAQNGIESYPISSERDYELGKVVADFDKLSKEKTLSLAGRVMSLRPQGALIFFHLDDGTAKFQGLLKKDEMKESDFDFFSNNVDIGDFIEVKGLLFMTKRGEKTIKANSWKMLSKSLRPLPEKWHGLSDTEERFRKRYLDALMSPEVKTRFILRSRIITELRKILDGAGFLEVETPILQSLAGGASAEPFKTHHNALDIDLFLRIAPEIYLKKLLIGGFPKVYEIGRSFRNEGIDMTHNPEFTTVEWYESYSDASKQMIFVESVIGKIVKETVGKETIVFQGNKIDFSKKFEVVSYLDLLKKYAGIKSPETIAKEEIISLAKKLGVKTDKGDGLEKIMDSVYKKTCRPKLIQPTFINDYPVNYLPLAKKTDKDKNLADAFQVVAGGMEIVKAFSELNDPIDQRERFSVQEKYRKDGDKEAQPADEDFIEAMEYGIPPAGGLGLSIDRLTMLLSNAKNIKEAILFPAMRPSSIY
ncbi:MAG: lysine--tRNA ligase [Patescibacteria group bacterium]|nr:lysine--tRNA ligase [Patescibacteria group bacterium]MDE1988572.1 lysine--tRNA ligase [Patescibacteria group bacterium]MDE2218173.1 lysine--tRNA ligase [Patescibacteria group bacterium]